MFDSVCDRQVKYLGTFDSSTRILPPACTSDLAEMVLGPAEWTHGMGHRRFSARLQFCPGSLSAGRDEQCKWNLGTDAI